LSRGRPFDKKPIPCNPENDVDEGLLQEVFLNDIGVENQAARIGRYPHTKPLTTSSTPSPTSFRSILKA
jgi:hypothetical protein